jgi:hypothetical protein
MKRFLAVLLLCLIASPALAETLISESFEGGYGDFTARIGDYSIVSDATAPDGASVLQIRFASGFPDGNAPAVLEAMLPSTVREVYGRFYFKLSSNFVLPENNLKGVFLWAPTSHNNVVGLAPWGTNVNYFSSQAVDGPRWNGSVSYSKNVWNKVDYYMKYNSAPGAANGIFKLWLNDELSINLTNVVMVVSGRTYDSWHMTQISPVYGGNDVPATQYLWIDKFEIQTTPFGGTPEEPVDQTPPYVDGRSPASGATGVALNSNIVFHVKDLDDGVDSSTITMTVEGASVTPTVTGTSADYTVTYNPPSDFTNSQVVNVTASASDLAGNSMGVTSWSFTAVAAAPDPLALTTTSPLPQGLVGVAYEVSLTAEGGSSPYTFSVKSGDMPPGLTLTSTGVLSGTPTTAGTYGPLVFTVTDSAAATDDSDALYVLISSTPSGQVVTTNFTILDTYIGGGSSTNWSDSEFLRTYVWPYSTPANRILVQVADLGLPDNIAISSAVLSLYLPADGGYEGSGGTDPINIYASPVRGQDWTIGNVTWATFDNADIYPYQYATLDGAVVSLTPGWYNWRVTSEAQYSHANGTPMTILLSTGMSGDADTNRYFVSMEGSPSYHPVLTVTYTPLTAPPSEGGVPVSAPGRIRVSKMVGRWR